MRSRQYVLFNFGSFLPKFGGHGNSLGSLEILDSIFEIADPENATIHANFVNQTNKSVENVKFSTISQLEIVVALATSVNS